MSFALLQVRWSSFPAISWSATAAPASRRRCPSIAASASASTTCVRFRSLGLCVPCFCIDLCCHGVAVPIIYQFYHGLLCSESSDWSSRLVRPFQHIELLFYILLCDVDFEIKRGQNSAAEFPSAYACTSYSLRLPSCMLPAAKCYARYFLVRCGVRELQVCSLPVVCVD